jgi:hypothetical protein
VACGIADRKPAAPGNSTPPAAIAVIASRRENSMPSSLILAAIMRVLGRAQNPQCSKDGLARNNLLLFVFVCRLA